MKKKFCLTLLSAFVLGLWAPAVYAKSNPGTPKKYFLTQQDVDELFGNLPVYLDLGSFVLNRLNHIPLPRYQNEYMLIEKRDGTYLKSHISFDQLREQIESVFALHQGDWSVYIKDLKTGNTISINEHPMQSASLIKLYIAGTALERIQQGLLFETDTIRNALEQMIIVSDNESANILVRSFYNADEGQSFRDGLNIVNDFNARHGYTNTTQANGIADPNLWISEDQINETSTGDCGKILEDIYNSDLVSHYASYRFENLLNRQQVNYKIPSGLPEGTTLAHKTGEVSDTENDAAIIYTPYGDYIFCIMSTKLEDTGDAVDTIRLVTRLVYNWFTNPLEEVLPEELETEAVTEFVSESSTE